MPPIIYLSKGQNLTRNMKVYYKNKSQTRQLVSIFENVSSPKHLKEIVYFRFISGLVELFQVCHSIYSSVPILLAIRLYKLQLSVKSIYKYLSTHNFTFLGSEEKNFSRKYFIRLSKFHHKLVLFPTPKFSSRRKSINKKKGKFSLLLLYAIFLNSHPQDFNKSLCYFLILINHKIRVLPD